MYNETDEHEEMRGRMHGFGGFGRHMGAGMQGRGMFGGLRGFVLNLLEKKPMRGIEIIDKVDSATMGMWKPSPGSVYPLLSSMEKEGFLKRGDNSEYELTQKGKEHLEERRSLTEGFSPFSRRYTPERMISDIDSYLTYFQDLGKDASKYLDALKTISEKLNILLQGL